MRYYNGFSEQEIATSDGLVKLGIEHIKPLVTRGHLVDAAGLKGRMLNQGEEITLADVRAALSRQGMREDDIRQGDAILFHTGWGRLWMKDNAKFSAGGPGPGLEVARWVIERGLCLTGGDTSSVEVVPNPDPTLAYPLHGELLTKNGIFNHENLVFDELLADRKYSSCTSSCPCRSRAQRGRRAARLRSPKRPDEDCSPAPCSANTRSSRRSAWRPSLRSRVRAIPRELQRGLAEAKKEDRPDDRADPWSVQSRG